MERVKRVESVLEGAKGPGKSKVVRPRLYMYMLSSNKEVVE